MTCAVQYCEIQQTKFWSYCVEWLALLRLSEGPWRRSSGTACGTSHVASG